jgi:hypothetical protein
MRWTVLIAVSVSLGACAHVKETPAGYAAAAPVPATNVNNCEQGFDQVMTKLEGEMEQPPPVESIF